MTATTHTAFLGAFVPRCVRRDRRGFTLVELLAVVTMIAILSALAIVGYRRYIDAAKSSDAKAVIGAIRLAEEQYRAETLSYLGCSPTINDYYPVATAVLEGKKYNLRPAATDNSAMANCWRILSVTTDSPSRYTYAIVAGGPGDVPPTPSTVSVPTWPATTEPWFVVQAAGDNNDNNVLSYFVSSSFTGEIYVENESE